MSFQFALHKVMELKEREKNNSQTEYEAALRNFEVTATELYHMLKNKEELEEQARQQIERGTSIFELQQSESNLLRLQQEIYAQQQTTQRAREKMNIKQQQLMDTTIEFKKYEKMKELKKEQFEQEVKRLEAIEMDELSMQIYANR